MKTNTVTEFVGKAKMVTSDCVSIAFFRPTTNTNDVRVNGVPLEAGQTFTIDQKVGNLDITQYQVDFTDLGAPNTNELYVIRTLLVP